MEAVFVQQQQSIRVPLWMDWEAPVMLVGVLRQL
jgi:hypothetical protein